MFKLGSRLFKRGRGLPIQGVRPWFPRKSRQLSSVEDGGWRPCCLSCKRNQRDAEERCANARQLQGHTLETERKRYKLHKDGRKGIEGIRFEQSNITLHRKNDGLFVGEFNS